MGRGEVTVSAVAAGKQHSVALASDGRVFTWGSGHLGHGSSSAASSGDPPL